MTAITAESMRQYKEFGTFTECGGIEVARTPEHARVSSPNYFRKIMGHRWWSHP